MGVSSKHVEGSLLHEEVREGEADEGLVCEVGIAVDAALECRVRVEPQFESGCEQPGDRRQVQA
ncbi:MAG: hypothetical protein QG597_3482 [Actinomycetota bacterium]|nr:hypothetical protein [Actinomycetota bacterium]